MNATVRLYYVCFSTGMSSIFFVIPVIHSRVQRESVFLSLLKESLHAGQNSQWSEFKVVDRLVEVFASLFTKVSNESWPRVWRGGLVFNRKATADVEAFVDRVRDASHGHQSVKIGYL